MQVYAFKVGPGGVDPADRAPSGRERRLTPFLVPLTQGPPPLKAEPDIISGQNIVFKTQKQLRQTFTGWDYGSGALETGQQLTTASAQHSPSSLAPPCHLVKQ